MIRVALSSLMLASSLQHLKAGRFDVARRRLDHAISVNRDVFDFVRPYEGVLMIYEHRHEEARSRFSECLRSLPLEKNPDEEYISIFCRFYLAAYDGQKGLEELRDAALAQDARPMVKRFLSFPPRASIDPFLRRTASHR